MNKIYVVCGQTGEWSDHREWSVKAFADESLAKEMVLKLSNWCDQNQVGENCKIDYYSRIDLKNPDDPNFSCDYTGTRYSYYEVPFVETSNNTDYSFLNSLCDEVMETAKSKGFYSSEKYDLPKDLTALHAEVSELYEAYMHDLLGTPCDKSEKMLSLLGESLTSAEEECADLIIKSLCIASALGIDISKAVRVKSQFNKTRPFRHGKKH